MAFEYRYTLSGGEPRPVEYTITNSETVAVGDFVKVASGFALRADTGNAGNGIVIGIVDSQGRSLDRDKANYDGTWTASTRTYAASADNQTDKQVKVQVYCSKEAVYSVNADADLGTTTGSNLAGYSMDVETTASAQLDESSATDAATAQFYSLGLDPENSERVLVTMQESLLD